MILSSTVRIKSKKFVLMPVKTDKEIKHESIPMAMELINKVKLVAPVKIGEIIIENFTENGINLVATKTILE